ncbi:MAG: hypothetical protein HC895_05275 [Leptolyngbyaceae cyanobacterium SM1_3_5]|nr:hypothetical protein [Leptolyngbyaceae cyanobacterium SM1_3_5]
MGRTKGTVIMRQDLLALTIDDLMTLSNRGIVKRSQQELQSGQLTFELSEDENGNVSVNWSDQIECRLPIDRPLQESICTCPATSICRHLIRSVLVYQEFSSQTDNNQKIESQAEASSSQWNPGEISDETLTRFFKKTLNKIRQQFDEGQVISLTRSSKPIAQIHTLSCTVRFLVAGDLRYTHCDCAESAPCSHVPLAVWAFRLLEIDRSSGIVSTRQTAYPIPTNLLDDIEKRLEQFVQTGISGAAQSWRDQVRRLELRCRENSLIWLAEILSELVQEFDRYIIHDARFSPQHLTELIGELCIRSDAIRSNTDAVPQLFIRGSQADRTLEVGSARLIGLGCGVQIKHHSVELTAYCQDVDSGAIVALCRNFPDPPDSSEPAKDFDRLAQTSIVKGISLAQIGTGKLLIKGGKRTPSHQFLPGRAPVSFNPQAYQWEMLRSSVLVEDFIELADRLSSRPPASLRPRRLSENLFVCKVATVEAAAFNSIDQTVEATLRDRSGNRMRLIHPYTSRGRSGTEVLLSALNQQPEAVFVAGQVVLSAEGLIIAPIALILQRSNSRFMLQPWLDSSGSAPSPNHNPSFAHLPIPHLPISPTSRN